MEYLKRKMDEYLINWKNDANKKPLIIKGARQIGKTKTILHFANKNYTNIIEINFVENPIYKQIIENGYTPESIIKNISRINPSFKFIKGETLFFFDEIQELPDIATSLKFFAQDGNYDVICSGSLLGVNYNEISSISVGYKTEINMYSMDFEEFLWAKGYENSIKDDILNHMIHKKPFSDSVLKIYDNLFLDYCIVGGMPEVVLDFISSNTFSNTLELQRQIIIGYKADIRKYALGLDKERISQVFESIPYQLSKENKKFQISKIKSGATFYEYRSCIEWLRDAGIINICRALHTPQLPLNGNVEENICKVYYADSGLLLSQLDDESQLDLKQNKNLNIYKGGLFENIIGEALSKQGYELKYYKKQDSTLEEDFFIRCKDFLVPIESKAGNTKSKSLSTLITSDIYPEISFGIKLIKGNIGYHNKILTLPHFCAFLVKDFISNINIEKDLLI